MKGYLPLGEKELSARFPLHTVCREFVPWGAQQGIRIGTIGVRFLEPNKIQFSGPDLAGKNWTVTAGGLMGGALYSADLDHNGRTDLMYASFTGGNGLAPPMHVLTLMFDSTGRPVLSEMDGYFETDVRGLKDLLDLDGDGRAELIRQSFDDGYWITSLYEARDARWRIIHGQHADRQYPMYTRFTKRANRNPTIPAPGRHPVEDNLSNDFDTASPALNLENVQWANVQQSGDPLLRFSNGRNCAAVGWYSTAAVVIDTPQRRIAATLGAPEEAKMILDEIVRSRIPVHVAGSRRNRTGTKPSAGWCSVEMVWGANNTKLP
ncbi:MAG: hypothetical protein LLG20_04745 [Acidobacteriales bacterium]|nr:hypothetical protein [Terriglobales bacterium]